MTISEDELRQRLLQELKGIDLNKLDDVPEATEQQVEEALAKTMHWFLNSNVNVEKDS
jgi:hypothetical protein